MQDLGTEKGTEMNVTWLQDQHPLEQSCPDVLNQNGLDPSSLFLTVLQKNPECRLHPGFLSVMGNADVCNPVDFLSLRQKITSEGCHTMVPF